MGLGGWGVDQLNLHANSTRIMSVGEEQVLCVVHCKLELKQKLYNLASHALQTGPSFKAIHTIFHLLPAINLGS